MKSFLVTILAVVVLLGTTAEAAFHRSGLLTGWPSHHGPKTGDVRILSINGSAAVCVGKSQAVDLRLTTMPRVASPVSRSVRLTRRLSGRRSQEIYSRNGTWKLQPTFQSWASSRVRLDFVLSTSTGFYRGCLVHRLF